MGSVGRETTLDNVESVTVFMGVDRGMKHACLMRLPAVSLSRYLETSPRTFSRFGMLVKRVACVRRSPTALARKEHRDFVWPAEGGIGSSGTSEDLRFVLTPHWECHSDDMTTWELLRNSHYVLARNEGYQQEAEFTILETGPDLMYRAQERYPRAGMVGYRFCNKA